MKKRILVLLLLLSQFGIAQVVFKEKDDVSSYGILLGVHGARETMVEIGFFKSEWFGGSGKEKAGRGFSISTEHYINEDYIIAPKLAGFGNLWGIDLGLGSVWYFDMEDHNSLRLRPEIGYGCGRFKLTYGLNMTLTHKDMQNISKHMVSFVYFFNFNKKANKVQPSWLDRR